MKKISVALGHEELAWAQRRAKREGTSVSAVITAAARRAAEEEQREPRQREAWAEIVAWATKDEPFTPEEIAAADRELGGAEGARRRARARGKRRVA